MTRARDCRLSRAQKTLLQQLAGGWLLERWMPRHGSRLGSGAYRWSVRDPWRRNPFPTTVEKLLDLGFLELGPLVDGWTLRDVLVTEKGVEEVRKMREET